MPLTPGARLGPYEISHPIGAGGMGEVHRARHLKLRRDVAIKVLPTELAGDAGRLARLEREARTASALNHPNIVTIHDIGEQDGITYIAMELVEGRTLREIIGDGPLPIDRAIGIATQTANALAKAHAAGIIHRDIKPANVMVTTDGLAKVLDFGLAKPLTTRDGRAIVASTRTADTQEGVLIGTPHYMSPEQLSGDPVDHRSDQFAFGVLLYEMVSGKSPFDGPSLQAIISAIIANPPPALRKLRADVPADLERIVYRCLEKDPAKRFLTTAELARALHQCEIRRASSAQKLRSFLRRPAAVATFAVIVLALAAWGWKWSRGAEQRWARTEALTQIASLTESGDLYAAYRTARRAEKHLVDRGDLNKLVQRITLPVRVNTKPPGAGVWVKGYATPEAPWEPVGVTPLELRIPYALMRWRISKEGFEPFEGAPLSGSALRALAEGLILDSLGGVPPGTVRIPAGPLAAVPGRREDGLLPVVQVPTFFLDRYEVTNRLFREFVDAGGYEKPEYWPVPFEREGKIIPWAEAMSGFRDATGQRGPSTWEAGSYAAGEDDHPVSGVSWFEALAYCTFARKTLPTIFHWFRAIGQDQFSDILNHSNMNAQDKAGIGAFKGVSGYGTYDMAGNVKEWTWNASGNTRFILGGAWNEPAYLFRHLIAQDPWGREETYGMRCARYAEPPAEQLTAPVTPMRKYAIPAPVTDDAFALLRGLYAYDPAPLEAEIVRVNDSLPPYRRETVSIKTAYGNERMEVHLLIPRDAAPPYQSVIWFPGGDVYMLRSSEHLSSSYLVDFIPRSGRVLVQIVYENMYERFDGRVETPGTLRDLMVRWSQDIGRTIDYLETRSDFDARKIAYYALSGGAIWGATLTALEPRFAASIMVGGGLVPVPYRPEMHPALFAPRSRLPTLMINGRDDFMMPYEMSQRPLFALLGTPEHQKRHAVLDGGHIPTDRRAIMREVLDWLDGHLGPVRRTTSVARAAPAQ